MSSSAFTPAVLTVSSGAGSGSGEKNYITNPSAASAITGWGVVGDFTLSRTTAASDLPREYSTATGIKVVATSAVQSTADYIYFDFNLDDVDLGRKLKIQWSQKKIGTYSAGQLAVVITSQADRTTALITPQTTAIPASDLDFVTTFDSTTTAALSLVIRATADMTTGDGICISDVIVGPGEIVQGAAVSNSVAYTPVLTFSGGTTISSQVSSSSYTRIGEQMLLQINEVFTTATATPTGVTISIPSNLTTGGISGQRFYGSADCFNLLSDRAGSQVQAVQGGQTVDLVLRSGVTYSAVGASRAIRAEVLFNIAEWSGSGTVSLGAGAQVEYAYFTGTLDLDSATDGSATAYGPTGASLSGGLSDLRNKYIRWQYPPQNDDLILVQTSSDSGVSWSTTRQPWDGNATSTSTAGARFVLTSAAGISRFQIGRYAEVATTAWSSTDRIRFVKVKASSPVGFGLAGTDGSAGLYKPGSAPGQPNGSAIAAGYIGEVITSSLSRSSATSLTSASFFQVGSVQITLTPGVWLVSGVLGFTGTSTAVTQHRIAYSTSTSSKPDGTDYDNGQAVVGSGSFNLNNQDFLQALPSRTISVSANTTYYLVGYSVFSGGTSGAYGRLTAVRIA